MSRYTKLATCLFIAFIGLVGYFIYLGLEQPERMNVSVETIEGDASLLDDWEIAGSIQVEASGGITSSGNHLYVSQASASSLGGSSQFDYFTLKENQTHLTSDLSFFERLDSSDHLDQFLSQIRLDYPNFMRNKSILFTHVLETERQVITGNFKGDYDLSEGAHSSEFVIDILDKETEETKEYIHPLEDLQGALDNRVETLYQTEETIYALIRSYLSEQEGTTFTSIEFDKESEQFTQTPVHSGNFGAITNLYEHSPMVLFEESEVASDADSELSIAGYHLFDLETGEWTELPSFDSSVSSDQLTLTPTLSEEIPYVVVLNEEGSQIDLLRYDKQSDEWEPHQEVEVLIDEEVLFDRVYYDEETPYPLADTISHSIQHGYFLVYTYWGNHSVPIHLQATDLETGELIYFGTLDIENPEDYAAYNLNLLNLRLQP